MEKLKEKIKEAKEELKEGKVTRKTIMKPDGSVEREETWDD
jgi:hypothetical protein